MTATTCNCCWIATVELGLSNDLPFCQPCRAHQFSLDNLRRDHQALIGNIMTVHAKVVSDVRALIDKDKATIEALRERYDDLVKATGTDLANASEEALNAIGGQAISALQGDVRNAYRTRDRAMDAVWTIEERHHAAAVEKCSCGQMLRACKEYKGLDFFRADYERWERKQIELMKAGKDHGLPENHPEARKLNVPSYQWHGMRSTEPELQRRRAG